MDSDVPSPSTSFDAYQPKLQSTVLNTAKVANGLPPAADMGFQRTIDRKFAKDIDSSSVKVLNLANRLLSLVQGGDSRSNDPNGKTKANGRSSEKGKQKALLTDEDDVLDGYHTLVVDIVDQLLESADKSLDEVTGRNKPAAIKVNVPASSRKPKQALMEALDPSLLHAAYLPKPQLEFSRKVDNSNLPSKPRTLQRKYSPNEPSDPEASASTLPFHPYRFEIEHIEYPSRMFERTPPLVYRSYESTPYQWVSTVAELNALLAHLRTAPEIAVDLEYHNYRSFYGFVCLMQISTRERDWVVNTLVLREELEVLNEVFTDPKIVKVFHGAKSDILWSQQDFNLYIVNLFDTYHATKVLGFPQHSLAYLLSEFCDFKADKRYQLADWRIRPLPEEMLYYARSDTHYLLFIYDSLRNALLDASQGKPDSMRAVLRFSEETALDVYEKELYDFESGMGPNGWMSMARKWMGTKLAGTTKAVFLAVHQWRDQLAREHDESQRYLLPNQAVTDLAMKPPSTLVELMGTFSKAIPVAVRERPNDLLAVIQEAVKAGAEEVQTVHPAAVNPQAGVPPPSQQAPQSGLWSRPNGVTSASAFPASALLGSPKSFDTSALISSAAITNVEANSFPPTSLFGPSSLSAASPKDDPDRVAKELFTIPTSNSSISTSSSSLFRQIKPYTVQSSSLFGSQLNSSPTNGINPEFKDILAKVHNSITLAPPPLQEPPSDQTAIPIPADQILQNQTEIAFVPLSQRQLKPVEELSAVAVVRRKIKKSKKERQMQRDRFAQLVQDSANGSTSGAETSDTASTSKKRKERGPVEPFDYSSVPNILDDEPVPQQEPKQKKQKKNKEKGMDPSSNFPPTPKARNEPKSGNKSVTFK